jgi:hypothetical protein
MKKSIWIVSAILLLYFAYIALTYQNEKSDTKTYKVTKPNVTQYMEDRQPKVSNVVSSKNNENTSGLQSNKVKKLRFNLIGSDGVITSQAVEYAGLSSDKIVIAQESIKSLIDSLAVLARSNTSIDEIRTNENEGISAFRISPFPQKGALALDAFKIDIVNKLGKDVGGKLYETLQPHDLFAGCGKYEVIATFINAGNEGDSSDIRANWELRDPITGKVVQKTMATYEHWMSKFGNTLEMK